jgi:hypothetical protein
MAVTIRSPALAAVDRSRVERGRAIPGSVLLAPPEPPGSLAITFLIRISTNDHLFSPR